MNFILGMVAMYLLIGLVLSMAVLRKDIKNGYAKEQKYKKHPIDLFFRIVLLTTSWIILVIQDWR